MTTLLAREKNIPEKRVRLGAKSRAKGARINRAPDLINWRFIVVLAAMLSVFCILVLRAAYIQNLNVSRTQH